MSPSQLQKLEFLPPVDIDSEGVFKYVLMEVYGNDKDPMESPSTEISKLLVRGYGRAEYHADIYEEVEEKEIVLRDWMLNVSAVGGLSTSQGIIILRSMDIPLDTERRITLKRRMYCDLNTLL
ncbi:Sex-regulated protein janus-A [Caligus rogercresseyi]|uniref:Sex-regulated protein janus-A n=1 Tax=Caligus rogercresseyi TaxID=217165 RepID=A0A7T8GPS9_CALRO|nr:Sex-regulated protein janus-A [Caligus rogercresseyi]